VYVLRQNCRAAGWRWDSKLAIEAINIIGGISVIVEIVNDAWSKRFYKNNYDALFGVGA
jgi:hypothetical protein